MSKSKVAEQIVTVDRRRGSRREEGGCGSQRQPLFPIDAKSSVDVKIDPTTCESDYTEDEMEFMQALDAYKRSSNRMFPTCSEVLEVLRGLGYVKASYLSDESADCDREQACPS